MEAGHRLHLRDEPGPVALRGEVHGEVPAVGADAGHDAHAAVRHGAPLVLGRGHVGPHPHPVPHLERLAALEAEGLAEELHVDVAHPVGAALPLPHHLHVQVVEAVPVQLRHAANVTLMHLLVSPAAAHRHARLDVVPDIVSVLVIGLEVCSSLEVFWRRDAGGAQHPLTGAARVNVLE